MEASNCLGKMYLNGDGVVREYEKAWRHFLISGEQYQNKDGLYWMGYMYEKGLVRSGGSAQGKRIMIDLTSRWN